ncbi:flagellar biosynthesis protein FlgM, partial [Streptomyces sp. SID2955]|nr:flagellar biosynthesis protein FlgM [Streptomyces sp. SID2955]
MAVAVAVTTAATGLAGTAFAGPATKVERPAASAAPNATAVVEAARTAAFAHASATGVSKGDALHAQDVMIDPEGARHVRFVRTHDGLPVLGGDLIVHLDRGLAYTGVTRAVDHTVQPATAQAKLTAGQAAAKAAQAAKGPASGARLVVDARGGAAALAYQVTVAGKDSL